MPDTTGQSGVEFFEEAAAKRALSSDSAHATKEVVSGTGNSGVAAEGDGHSVQEIRWGPDVPVLAKSVIAGGSLAADVYYYAVGAHRNGKVGPLSNEVAGTISGTASAKVRLTWDAVGVTAYRVYGGTVAATYDQYWDVTALTYDDDGTPGTST